MNNVIEGDIAAYRRTDGSVRLEVTPGPLRVTRLVVEQADPQWLSCDEGVLTFCGIEDDGSRQSYSYRVVGDEPGPEGGWLLCEPLP